LTGSGGQPFGALPLVLVDLVVLVGHHVSLADHQGPRDLLVGRLELDTDSPGRLAHDLQPTLDNQT
jgi:hypothetical protein